MMIWIMEYPDAWWDYLFPAQ